ncbi:MAG: hypothetical protein ACO1OG_05075 [Devosia sp.]
MPTLIRLIVILLVLGGIGYGAMYGLVMMVEPREKVETIRIPARELMPQASGGGPIERREINTTRPTTPAAPATMEVTPTPAGEDGEVTTLAPGNE